MANPDRLKDYLKQEIQSALGIRIDSAEFDRVMGGFAKAIDKYLKQDIEVAVGIESRGEIQLPQTSSPSPGPNPSVASRRITVDVKSRTTGKLE
jgi:hypothetical protein